MTIEIDDVYKQVAEIVHEANRAFCKTIGDNSQVPWDDAPDWQKDSSITVVRQIINEEINGPEETHKVWMKTKIAEGWKYGEVKDADAKTHPYIVPYEQLPPHQRKKDDIVFGVCLAFMV